MTRKLFFHGVSFKNKLIFSFVLVSLLPILIVQAITYYYSTQALKTKIDELVKYNLVQTSKNLDTTLLAYEDILFQIYSDEHVVDLINNMILGSDFEKAIIKSELLSILTKYTNAKDGIRSVAIFMRNGDLISYDQQTGSSIDNLWSNSGDVTQLPLYRDAIALKQGTIMTMPAIVNNINNKEQYVFHIARKLTNFSAVDNAVIGAVVISMYESVLSNASNSVDPNLNEKDTNKLDSYNFLVDSADHIVSATDKKSIGSNVNEIMGNSAIINRYTDNKSGWTIVNVTDQKSLFQEMYAMQRISLITGIIAILVSAILIFYFSGNLTKSIGKIVSAMKLAQKGRLGVQIDEGTKDEISIIAISFNKMMNEINQLMVETKEATQKQKEAEIRALEAQINPHFLYNTIDSINWMAIEKNEHEISRMLKGLAQILRYSIHESNSMVTVQEEVEWLKQYVYLQQNRFDSSFQCFIECEDNILHLRIYKLLLQPFIENSIIYGFAGVKSGGRLHIRIFKQHQVLCIQIEDNGIGIEESTVESFMQEDQHHFISKGTGMGIRNVIERLKIYYGDQAEFKMTSQMGVGTTIHLAFPYDIEGKAYT